MKCFKTIGKATCILLLLLTTSFAQQILPGINPTTYLKFYDDGIYDALKQIKEAAQEGLSQYPLDKQIKGNIVVAVPTKNMSITEIIRIKTSAIKDNYVKSITATNLKDGKHYIVFDSFDREADANYALTRLKDYNINAEKIYNGTWVKHPIIIKKIVDDLKSGVLSDTPVKIIEVEKIIYRDRPKANSIHVVAPSRSTKKSNQTFHHQTNHLSVKQATVNSQKNIANYNKNKERIKRLIFLIGKIKKQNKYSIPEKAFFYNGTKYKKGDVIDGFRIANVTIKKNKKQILLSFLFDHYYSYHLVFRRNIAKKQHIAENECLKGYEECLHQTKMREKPYTLSPGISQEKKVSLSNDKTMQVDHNNKNESTMSEKGKQGKQKTQTEPITQYYKCDFRHVRSLYQNGQRKLISSSNYSFLSNAIYKVLFVGAKNKLVFFKADGNNPAAISKNIWNRICKKTN